jgi:CO/xanthine dehydrogenase FAD-binding subunit
MVGVASLVRLQQDGTIAEARLGYTGAAPAPVRARDAEQSLAGQHPSNDAFAQAAELAAKDLDPAADVHAPAAYRVHVAKVLTRRVLEQAVSRAPGGAQ